MTCFEDMGKGTRSGWWGLSESEESFLDQIITWRELDLILLTTEEIINQ